MIFLILLLALSVNASEIDINYKWYKYTESSYMNYDEIKLLENVYVDYSDYQIDEYFNVKDYEITYTYVREEDARESILVGIEEKNHRCKKNWRKPMKAIRRLTILMYNFCFVVNISF